MRIFCPAIALSSSFYSCTAEYLVALREEYSALAPPTPEVGRVARTSHGQPTTICHCGVAPDRLVGLTGVSRFGAAEHIRVRRALRGAPRRPRRSNRTILSEIGRPYQIEAAGLPRQAAPSPKRGWFASRWGAVSPHPRELRVQSAAATRRTLRPAVRSATGTAGPATRSAPGASVGLERPSAGLAPLRLSRGSGRSGSSAPGVRRSAARSRPSGLPTALGSAPGSQARHRRPAPARSR